MSLEPANTNKVITPYRENATTTTNDHEPRQPLEEKTVEAQETIESLELKKARDLGTVSWICVVVSLLFSMFLFSLDNVIVADIQPSIIKTLGNIDKLPWISVGYALGATAVNLFVFDNPLDFAPRCQLTLLQEQALRAI